MRADGVSDIPDRPAKYFPPRPLCLPTASRDFKGSSREARWINFIPFYATKIQPTVANRCSITDRGPRIRIRSAERVRIRTRMGHRIDIVSERRRHARDRRYIIITSSSLPLLLSLPSPRRSGLSSRAFVVRAARWMARGCPIREGNPSGGGRGGTSGGKKRERRGRVVPFQHDFQRAAARRNASHRRSRRTTNGTLGSLPPPPPPPLIPHWAFKSRVFIPITLRA